MESVRPQNRRSSQLREIRPTVPENREAANGRWARLQTLLGLICLMALFTVPARAVCPQAVFFDLGDTLVEDGGGGLFVLRDGAQATVDGLQERGLEVGVITNVPAGWTREDLEAVLADPGFLDEFDVLVLSSQAPAPKPDPAIYLFAHGMLPTPVAIETTVFVGETLSEIADTELDPTTGARAAGMIGVHLSAGPPSPLADHTIPTDGLTEILSWVETSCATIFVDGFESGDTSAWP